MRIAVLGAAVAAFVGGTLAVTPLTTVSAPLPAGETCDGAGGAGCEKLAAVLMPEAPKPLPQRPEAPSFSEAGNVIAPQPAPEPGVPSAASEVPAGGAGGLVGGGGSAPVVGGAGMPVGGRGGVPDAELGGIPDPNALAPTLPGPAGLGGVAAAPNSAAVGLSVIQGVVGIGGSLVGIGTGLVGTVEAAVIAVVFLKNAGLLPSNLGVSLPSVPGVSLPSLTGFGVPGTGTTSLTTAAAAVPAVAAIPGAAAVLPAVGLPAVGLPAAPAPPAVGLPAAPAPPAVGLPAAAALPAAALPAAGLPAAPALPALPSLPQVGLPAAAALPALPAVGLLPAAPALPGLPDIPHPRFCTPSIGPIGACTP